jgi:large subunit ribosomal protein L12
MEYIYAALLLHKVGKPVDEAGLKKVIEAAGASFDEAKAKTLIASLTGVDIEKELANASVMAAAPAASAGNAPAEEKKEEVKTEAAAEGLSALFG